jgi:hypothetical protein
MAKVRGDLRYLVQHNGHPTWHCVKDVPVKLRDAVGKARLVKSLGTHDIVIARARRWDALAEFEQVLAGARDVTAPSRAVDAGMAWRRTLQRIVAGDPAAISAHSRRKSESGDTPVEMARSNAEEEIDIQADDFHDQDQVTFRKVAHGLATPLLHHVDAWLAEGGPKGRLNPRTAGQYRNDVGRLATWAKAANVPETVEAFSRAVAGRYVTETGIGIEVAPFSWTVCGLGSYELASTVCMLAS